MHHPDTTTPAILERDAQLAQTRRQHPAPTMRHVGSMAELALIGVMVQRRRERGQDLDAPYTDDEREWATRALEQAHAEHEDAQAMSDERERLAREARRLERLERLLRDTGVAPRGELFPAIVRGELDETEALRLTRTWMDQPRRFLALFGDSGTGKTVAASFFAVDALRRKRTVVHVTEAELVDLAKSNTNAARDELARVREAEVLIIEECGHTLASDAVQAGLVVFQLVNARIAMPQTRTVQVGNLNLQQAVERYGTRWADRMREVGRVHDIKLAAGERSMRARAARATR